MSKTAVITFCRARHFHLLCCVLLSSISLNVTIGSLAQADTVITPTTGVGDLGTHVLPPSGNVYGIIDGTPAGNNLYHSFAQFNVGTGDIAQFQTPTLTHDAAMHSILGRITDANPSIIFGTIDSATYYPSANLFLMNPYGFLFGPNATVNVGGMVAFTTADYLKLADTIRFEAIPGAHDALLSTFPVAAFGFLGSNPAAIAVQGSQLTVANETGLSFVGGNLGFTYTDPDTGNPASVPDGMTVTGGMLSAPNGDINLVGVSSPGEILLLGLQPAPNINGNVFTSFGPVTISGGSILDASGSPGGTVRIRSGQFVLDGSSLFANTTGDVDRADTAVEIHAQGETILRNASALVSSSDGAGRSGDIEIKTEALSILDGTAIFSGSFGSAPASNILVSASNSVSLTGTDPFGSGVGSTIFSDSSDFCGCTEPSGGVSIVTPSLSLDDQAIIQTRTFGDRRAGDITLDLGDLTVRNGSGVQTSGSELAPSGTIRVTATGAITLSGQFDSDTPSRILNVNEGTAGTGAIVLETGSLSLEGSARIRNEALASLEPGQDPKITIVANDNVNLSGGSNIRVLNVSSTVGGIDIFGRSITLTDQSVIRTETFGDGNAGPINITASDLSILSGSTVESSTFDNAGLGGNIAINLTGKLTLTGQAIGESGEVLSSNITSRTTGSGDGGQITISANSTTISAGAVINTSAALGTGNAGSVTIEGTQSPAQSVLIDGSGSGIFTNAQSTGTGGNISVNGNSVTMTNGSSVSASSTATGNAGNIQIDAGNQFVMVDSSVTTEANFASGGNIKITTAPSGTVELSNSKISASVLGGPGGGGNVDIDPQYVLLQNSQILARADQGPGGNITITITNGGLFLPDANSVVSASSGNPALNGTVTIQSPNAPASGQIQPLGQSPLLATSLLNQHCAALAGGEFSSFTVAGRDSLPTEPGSWLASPLATLSAGTGLGVKAEGGRPLTRGEGPEGTMLGTSSDGETPLLSLRQIAPAGFLTQAFAMDWSASCQS